MESIEIDLRRDLFGENQIRWQISVEENRFTQIDSIGAAIASTRHVLGVANWIEYRFFSCPLNNTVTTEINFNKEALRCQEEMEQDRTVKEQARAAEWVVEREIHKEEWAVELEGAWEEISHRTPQ
jgi:hypothetical protein